MNLKVYDVLGKEVATLVNREMYAGSHEAVFEASKFPSGTYFYRLETKGFTQTKKMLLLR